MQARHEADHPDADPMAQDDADGDSGGVGGGDGDERVYMSMVEKNRVLGVAVYVDSSSEMLISEMAIGGGDCSVKNTVEHLFTAFSVTVLVASSNSLQPDIVDAAKLAGVEVEMVDNKTFRFNEGVRAIDSFDSTGARRDEFSGALGTNFEETAQLVRAAGALLSFLQRGAIILHTPNAGSNLQRFRRFDGFDRCVLDADALAALQIFHQVNHPSVLMSAPKKEGMSLFGVLNRTVTAGGKRVMQSWLKRPSMSVEEINERHSAVEFFCCPAADIILNQVRSCLARFADVNKTLKRLASTQVPSVSSFSSLLATCQQCLALASLLSHAQASQPDSPLNRLRIAQKVEQCMTASPQLVITVIEGLVDLNESVDAGQLRVRHGVFPKLDNLKKELAQLDVFLSSVALEEKAAFPLAPPFALQYFPQLGFLVSISTEAYKNHYQTNNFDNPDDAFGMAMEFKFNTPDCAYFKTARCDHLDTHVGDLSSNIVDLEQSIVRDIVKKILQSSQSLSVTAEVSSELDVLTSFALVSKEYNLGRPVVVEEPVFKIINGRHLLQELASATAFVPNNTVMGSESMQAPVPAAAQGQIHVITGPNFSGKSVYIKQVGIMAVMSQAGCFIPADPGSVLGLVDRVFTRIHSRETCALHQSSFSIDLHQMQSALHHCTNRSLLLVDEFGKGSNPFDGISLLAACIQHLQSRHGQQGGGGGGEGGGGGSSCPRALITTHFSELQSHQLLQSQASIEFHQMQVELDESSSENQDKLDAAIVFLFKLVPGFAHNSFGLNCARLAGISDEVIFRAKEVSDQLGQGQEGAAQPIQPVTSEKAASLSSQVCAALAAFDVDTGDVQSFLSKIRAMQTATLK